jgi:hypothetical protein
MIDDQYDQQAAQERPDENITALHGSQLIPWPVLLTTIFQKDQQPFQSPSSTIP